MARTAATFKQADVQRLIQAAKACDLPIARIEVDKDGKIILVHGASDAPVETGSELDVWLNRNAG